MILGYRPRKQSWLGLLLGLWLFACRTERSATTLGSVASLPAASLERAAFTGSPALFQPSSPAVARQLEPDEPRPGQAGPAVVTEDLQRAGAYNQAFALKLLAAVSKTPGSFVFSPASMHLALALTWSGLRGEIGDISKGLGITDAAPVAERAFAAQVAAWSVTSAPIAIANTQFLAAGLEVTAEFAQVSKQVFRATPRVLDFARDAEAGRAAINDWAENQTQGMIKQLVPRGGVDAGTALVLANACYFKGAWEQPFDVDKTALKPFTTASGSKQNVRTMLRQSKVRYGVGRLSNMPVRAVELPYAGGDFELLLVVPDRFHSGELAVTAPELDALRSGLRAQTVRLELPQLHLAPNAPMEMVEPLTQAGLGKLFSADLSGIAGRPGELSVARVFHNAAVEINEQGTEASAATAVVVSKMLKLVEPVTLKVNKPFLFFLRDARNGALLFVGRVQEVPATE